MRKRSKNGFTIVELVIVIAVIGILTAILIPLFVNLGGKAQEADNQSFVRNINTQLAMNEADKGSKNAVMEDSIKLAQDIGFDVTKITPYNNNDIVWDSVHDRFAILKSDYAQNKDKKHVVYADASFDVTTPLYQLWKVYGSYENNPQTYSIYAKETTSWDNVDIDNLKVGFDAGKNAKINSIRYVGSENSQDVVIRTNEGVLTIDAEKDTVKHYGSASLVNIEAINTASYHEFGQVKSAQIKTGRIVIENSESKIENVLLVAKSDLSGFDDIIVETKGNAELPTLDRTDVVISSTGTLVANIVTPETNEFIYLTKAGVIEQIVVTETKQNDVSGVDANVNTKSETTKTVAEQVANVGKKNDQGEYVDSNNQVIDIADLTSENIIYTETKASQEELEKGKTIFAGGAGSQSSPFIIANERQWEKLCLDEEDIFWGSGYHYSIINDLDFENLEGNFSIGLFTGYLDFNGHHLLNLTAEKAGNTLRGGNWSLIYGIVGEVKISNLNFYVYTETDDNFSWLIRYTYGETNDLTLENVNIYGTIHCTDNNTASFIYFLFGDNKDTVTMINCNNYATIVNNEGYSGIFIGGLYRVPVVELSFINCNNYGSLVGLNGSSAMLISNPTQYSGNSLAINIENCTNYGKIVGSKGTDYLVASEMPLSDGYTILSTEERAAFETEGKIRNSSSGVLAVVENASFGVMNGKYDAPVVEGADHYVIAFTFSALEGSNGGVMDYSFRLNPEELKSVNAYDWIDITQVENPSNIQNINIGQNPFQVYQGKYVFNRGTIHYGNETVGVTVVAYDSLENVIGCSVYVPSND